MKISILALALCACSGCTMFSLERHTLAQADTVIDMRYQECLENLASVAHDPAALPNYASIYSGTSTVTDTGSLTASTVWQHIGLGATQTIGKLTVLAGVQNGWGSQSANPSVTRTIVVNWPLDPIVVPEKLEAMRAASRWVLYGPEKAYSDCPGLLDDPDEVPPGPGRHFNVARRLAALPSCWLQHGCLKDVPLHTLYKAHCGDTWVWVTSEGMAGLADFTCIIQEIARVNSDSASLFNLPTYPSTLVFFADPTKVYRSYPIGMNVTAQVTLDPLGHLVPTTPYFKSREDDVGTDSNLRGLINAAGTSP